MAHSNRHEIGFFWRRCMMVAATALAVATLLWFASAVGHAFLLLFAAFLVAVGLDALGRILSRLTRISRHASVVITTTLLVLVLGAAIALGGMNIASQAPKLRDQVAQSIDTLQTKLNNYRLTRDLVNSSKAASKQPNSNAGRSNGSGSADSEDSQFGEKITSELTSAASVTLTTLTDLFVVVIVGIYLALRPRLYYNGLLRLFPPDRQGRVHGIADEASNAVRRWLTGRAISMTAVGLGSIAGLWIIGIPFPLLLGLFAGLLTFIPYLGALISAVPALLIAAGVEGVWPMLYVGLLYLGLHIIEGYVLAPLIQRHAASIAPAFLLSVQIIGGAIAGVLGVALAAPISLVITVIIQLGYVKDVIGETPSLPSEGPSDEQPDD